VPDVYQQFTKNQGIFTNPTSDKSPAKLRLAFEASPFGWDLYTRSHFSST